MRFVMDARYAGPKSSGIGNYVRALAARLPNLGTDQSFRFWIRPGTPALATAHNVSYASVSAPPASLATLLWPSRLDALSPDDVFHAPANVLGFGLRCRLIVTVHDVMWLEHLAWCQPRPWLRPISHAYYSTGIVRALRLARRILTVSKASADAIVRIEPSARQRIVVTPNACEPHFQAPSSLSDVRGAVARELGSGAPYFLVVGQNQPSKAHDVALRAFAAAGLPDHRLVLVQRLETGRGLSLLSHQLGIEQKVTFVSELSIQRLIALLQAATALLQPSLAEGFGLPALEAITCGCPVIASDIAPLREVLGAAGTFVAPGSVPELADALRALAQDGPRREELRAGGLERARTFSWDRTAELTWDVYRDVGMG